jgi:prepilin-type N-terminal cleavage/methylation domain-containing protein
MNQRNHIQALRQRWAQRTAHGFTIVEMTIAMALLSIVMTLAFAQLAAGVTQTAQVDRSSTANNDARLVVDQIVSELRQAATDDPLLPPVEAIGATTVTFYSPDRAQPKRLRKIVYRLTNGTLERSEKLSTNSGAAPWTFPTTTPTFRPMLLGVTNLNIFTFLDTNNIVTATPTLVRALTINIERSTALNSASERIYRTGIELRGQG